MQVSYPAKCQDDQRNNFNSSNSHDSYLRHFAMIHELIMHSKCTGIDHSEELSENELMTLPGGQRRPRPSPRPRPDRRPRPRPCGGAELDIGFDMDFGEDYGSDSIEF